MATMTISLPDPMKEWIETRVEHGEYASTSDYVRDLIRRDKERRSDVDLTIGDLRRIVDESRASGIGTRSVSDILADARRQTKDTGRRNG